MKRTIMAASAAAILEALTLSTFAQRKNVRKVITTIRLSRSV